MDFNDTQQKRDEAQWQSKLELLRQYQEQHGHCRVPQSYEIDGVKLGIWLERPEDVNTRSTWRASHAKITQERINALNEIGLEWFSRKSRMRKMELLPETKRHLR